MDHLPVDDPAAADTLQGSVGALIAASTETNRYIQALEQQLRSRTRALWGAILASALVVAFLGGAMLDNRRQIAANNLRWCPVVEPIAPRPGDPPPKGTPEEVRRALRIRSAFSKLVGDFKCHVDPPRSLSRSPVGPASTAGPAPRLTPPPTLPAQEAAPAAR